MWWVKVTCYPPVTLRRLKVWRNFLHRYYTNVCHEILRFVIKFNIRLLSNSSNRLWASASAFSLFGLFVTLSVAFISLLIITSCDSLSLCKVCNIVACNSAMWTVSLKLSTQPRFPTNILGFRRKETTEIIVGLI